MITQVKTQDMLDQLHLDYSEFGTIESLINFAESYIQTTTDSKATLEQIVVKTNQNIVNQAIRSIVESLYFGNAESDGFGVRSLVLLNSIRNMYQGA